MGKNLFYEATLFLRPPSFPLFVFLENTYFLLLSSLERETGDLRAFAEFGLAMLKVEFNTLFTISAICSPFLHQWDWDQLNCNTNCH